MIKPEINNTVGNWMDEQLFIQNNIFNSEATFIEQINQDSKKPQSSQDQSNNQGTTIKPSIVSVTLYHMIS